MNPVTPRDPATPTADVSCPKCKSGWWVTNPAAWPWTGCEDCEDEEGTVALTDHFGTSRLTAVVAGVRRFLASSNSGRDGTAT